MRKIFKSELTEEELYLLIKKAVEAVVNNESGQIAADGNEGFIDIKQASDYIKNKVSYIYKLVHAGTIPFHKSGKRLLFKKSELAEWIKK